MKIRVNYGKTVNLGNYQSERIDLSIEKDVEEVHSHAEMINTWFELKELANDLIKGNYDKS